MVNKLNQYRHEYYNENAPTVSDAVYDHLYDELMRMEKEMGIILSNSPTQTVGYRAVSGLEKVRHHVPLLSLDKTKVLSDLAAFVKDHAALLMLKLDGLTVKLIYEDGRLVEGSTRGDGDEGELITHNVAAFRNVPLCIPYKGYLELSGEGFIRKTDFERMKKTLVGSDGKPYRNARNLAAGSIRCLDANVCKNRNINFYAFNVLEGMDELEEIKNNRGLLLLALHNYGFDICPFVLVTQGTLTEEIERQIQNLQDIADLSDIPIDGMVLRYDSLSHSASLGRTGHHYNDGIAFKFEDDTYETVFRSIEWQTGRSGEIAPVAVFDKVAIDGCEVSRASLHNVSFIKKLELYPGCRILISKRNMIIPHVEENLDRGKYEDMVPDSCPCCGKATRIYSRILENGRLAEMLFCDNPYCKSRVIQKFVHFAEKKSMNIKGLSEATLEKLIDNGYLKTYPDLYHLNEYRDEIIAMKGFGEKSYESLWNSIQASRHTTFAHYLVSMDIPMIGKTASRVLEKFFHGSLQGFELAVLNKYDFTELEDFGFILNRNIHEWFENPEYFQLWRDLQDELFFENVSEAGTSEKEENMSETNNRFAGCTIVATGKLEKFTRDGITAKIISLGAIPGSSVTKKTDYLICGEKTGSKLAKAQQLGITVLTEQQFLEMLPV